MHEVVEALIKRDRPITVQLWTSFWDALDRGRLRKGETVALVASLSTLLPDKASVSALVDSLNASCMDRTPQDAINIVGSGGGARTFNISTASALVAATLGVPIVKSGSRAYSSHYGSIDMLELLGVPMVTCYDSMHEALDRSGIAFTGRFVYPRQLSALARDVSPLQMRKLGGFFNRIGPFLGAVPVSSQVTGVADLTLLPLFSHLARHNARRTMWLCFNDAGVDELVSFEENVISRHDGRRRRERRAKPRNRRDRRSRPTVQTGDMRLKPETLGLGRGSVDELRPAADREATVRHFTEILQGRGPRAAVESVCLNAAALVVAAGHNSEWAEVCRSARSAMDSGDAFRLLRRLRLRAQAKPVSLAGAPRVPAASLAMRG